MKILLLAPASNIHTQRWANGLASRGLEVHVASIHSMLPGYSEQIRMHRLWGSGGSGYFLSIPILQHLVRCIQPDLVNAHYATGYGTLARLSRCQPLLLSVWGSDVYDFPKISLLHRWWLKGNLLAARKLASTSHAMAKQTLLWCREKRSIAITPFGIDLQRFRPIPRNNDGVIRIGTVKTLRSKYGIDILLHAVAILRTRLDPDSASKLRLDIVGEGSQRSELERLAAKLGIAEITSFSGRISHENVPTRLSTYDIYVALSRLDSESFGVAILEASSCGLPVVVSDVGGLPEVVEHGRTGIVVPREDPHAAADALELILRNPQLAHSMGIAGRSHVNENYSWETSLDIMIDVYRRTLAGEARYE